MKLFRRLAKAQSFDVHDEQIRKIIFDEVSSLNVRIVWDNAGNIIVEKGDGPYPCFACHMDTVHKYSKKHKIREQNIGSDTFWSSPAGIGGDDKCGIWACIRLLQELENVKVVFFAQEEHGQIGAHNIDLKRFEDCCFICELDRLGNSDLIVDYIGMPTVSVEFEEDLCQVIPQGDTWELAEGFITDVMVLFERGIDISVMNLSCGYYNPHTKKEFVSWNDMNKMFRMAWNISTLTGMFYAVENTSIYVEDNYGFQDLYSQIEEEEGCNQFLFREDGTYIGSEFPDEIE